MPVRCRATVGSQSWLAPESAFSTFTSVVECNALCTEQPHALHLPIRLSNASPNAGSRNPLPYTSGPLCRAQHRGGGLALASGKLKAGDVHPGSLLALQNGSLAGLARSTGPKFKAEAGQRAVEAHPVKLPWMKAEGPFPTDLAFVNRIWWPYSARTPQDKQLL